MYTISTTVQVSQVVEVGKGQQTLFCRYMGALKYGILVLMDSQTISPSQACKNVPISATKISNSFPNSQLINHSPST